MTRAEGFTVMDVSTDVHNEAKFRRLQRSHPELVAPAFLAYMAVLGESWKAGRRRAIEDSWPVLIPFSGPVINALIDVGLLDSKGHIPSKSWNGWFKEANERREKARERWRRANERRANPNVNVSDESALSPRGSNAATSTSAPSVPTVPSVPSEGRTPRARTRGNGHAEPDPYDVATTWLGQHGAWVTDGSRLSIDLARMVDRKGADVVIEAMSRVEGAEDAAQFVYGARNALFPLGGSVVESEPDPADVKAQLRARRANGGAAHA